ncbi:YitT family protein [Spiroplasma sp. SV19]|uniref:YitT family protein n=1 Tax=Spiroplasma sp. SV19 TaxID=2570468 RepID=UPI0024B7E054|nr:YitT family protein [Spiroplasma sp. SV19]WHQ36550.1 YitT family protein [Spiroplasma sp. SV19]
MAHDEETYEKQDNNTSGVGPEDVESKTIDAYKEGHRKTRSRERISRKEFNLRFKSYFKSRLFRDYGYITFAAFLAMVSYDYFIVATTSYGIMPSGIGAIARGVAVAIWPNQDQLAFQTSMYWVFFFIFNLPLFIFGVIKVGIRFSIRTIVYIALQNGFHFAFAYIPLINPQELFFITNYSSLNVFSNYGGMYQIWLFVFAAVAGILNGIACGLVYKGGASTAGTDFVLAYYSVKKKTSIANYNRIVNYIIVIVMLAIHTALLTRSEITGVYFGTDWEKHIDAIQKLGFKIDSNGLYGIDLATHKAKYFFGPVLFASYLFVVVQSITIDIIFPKFKYRSLMVITSKGDTVVSGLQYVHYPNDIIRIPVRDYYEGTDINNELIIVSTSLLEYKWIKAAIVVSDPDAKILSYKLDKIITNYKVEKY